MAYGDTEHDEALRTAWHDFCDRLKEVGELVFADPSPAHRRGSPLPAPGSPVPGQLRPLPA